ncbi:tetratricopeptide repeat protein [Lyngbya aestuarii]|uniref:tetratricopeptide repeat protein n=1 Tax=Lyngbya aestuarii TaxID=118322 RepID=UPI00403D6B48
MNLGLGETLGGRYKIITQLGQGGFGQTFVAQDYHLPGNQQCVVKQLKPQATDPTALQTARRLFETEAQVLYKLGRYEQIPQLFAYFEENQEFYLVQELIEGEDLSKELTPGKQLSENQVISLLQEILEILEFVHQQNVIHRDINPRNIIRRKQDGKLILIDFGAVKQVSTQVINGAQTNFTVAIGTPGYRPGEQANGHPRLSSDIYAVGMVGIYALTGISPHELPNNPDTGEISWQDQASVSLEFARVLDKMVCYDFRHRYQSANAALQALKDLQKPASATLALPSASPSQPVLAKSKAPTPLLQKLVLSIAVIGLGAAVSVSAVKWINSANATDLYNRGETLLELKRYQAALDAYDKAVAIRPEYAEAWHGQGNTLSSLKRYEEALDAYDKAIQIQPDYFAAWKGRGKTLENLQRYGEASDALEAAIKIEPNHLEAWESLGNVQIELQQYATAITSFEKVLELQPDYSPAWYRRGWALHNLGQYEEAIVSYDQAVEYKPDYSPAWYQRGNALINLDRYKEAVKSYEKATQFQPSFYQAWYSQGSALINLRRYEEAVASFDKVVKAKPNHYEAWYSRGWALHNLRRYEEAIASYDRAIKLQPNSSQAWYNKGNALYQLSKYPEAIAAYDRTLKNKPNHYEALYSRGNALVNSQQYKLAIESYKQALRYQQDYPAAQKALQQAQRELEETQEAGNNELEKTKEEGQSPSEDR